MPLEDSARKFFSNFNYGVATALGAPVDIANMGLNLFGLGTENPFAGSQDIVELFNNLGIETATEEPQDLLNRIPYVMGDLLTGGLGGLKAVKEPAKIAFEAAPVKLIDELSSTEDALRLGFKEGKKIIKQVDNETGQLNKLIAKAKESKDFQLISDLAYKKQLLRETKEAATETGSVGFALKEGQITKEQFLTPVEKVTEALKKAKPIRGQQELLYSKERSKLGRSLNEIDKKYSGEEAAIKKLQHISGKEFSKVDFEPLKIAQDDADGLFDMIRNSDLYWGHRLTAESGLRKILGAEGGKVPTRSELKELLKVFPEDMLQELAKKRPALKKLWYGAEDVLNLPRTVMASVDLSAPLRQGIFMVRRQRQFAPAFKDMFKYAFSEKAYQGFMKSLPKRPTFGLMEKSGLSFTDLGADMLAREERFMSKFAEKLPFIRGSARAYTGFLNKLRADVFDDLIGKAVKSGLDPELIGRDIASYVNAATGRGSLGALEKAGPILNASLFSPRLIASRIQLVGKVFNPNTTSFVRKEMLKDWAGFLGTGMTVLGLAKLGGATVGDDPRSADFGKVKIGDTRYDVWGGFQQYAVLMSRLISGQMVSSTTGKEFTLGDKNKYKPTTRTDILSRGLEYKTSPVASFAISSLRGRTAIGKEFNFAPEIVDRMIPIVAQDVADIIREEGLGSAYKTAPAIFGVGVQTYGDMVPYQTEKGTFRFRPEQSLGEILTGYGESNLTEFQQQILQDERRKKIDEEAKKQKLLEILQ